MKRFVSCLIVLALLAGFIVPLPVTVKAEETILDMEMDSISDIRILQDFAPNTITEANARINWEQAQSNTFVAGGKDGSDALRMYNDNYGLVQYDAYGYDSETVGSAWRAATATTSPIRRPRAVWQVCSKW